MWKISRVKSAVIDFITGGHSAKQAQYGTQPTAPATPASGGTSTTPQTTTPAPQPPAGMTCPAGQKMMLDPQTNQWKCMPETTAKKVESQILGDLIEIAQDKFGVTIDNGSAGDLLRYLWSKNIKSADDRLYEIKKWLHGTNRLPEMRQRPRLPENQPTEEIMTPVGPMQARVVGRNNPVGEGVKKEGQLTDLMDSYIEPHVDVFDWAVETFGPEDIIKTLKIEDVENVNLDNYKDQITQNYLPSYEEQIQSSDFDELFDRKDPVIEEQDYDNEETTNVDESYCCDSDPCEIDEVDSGLTAKKAQGMPQQKTWVWDDGIKDWKQVPVMSEWDTLMERRVQRQEQGGKKLSNLLLTSLYPSEWSPVQRADLNRYYALREAIYLKGWVNLTFEEQQTFEMLQKKYFGGSKIPKLSNREGLDLLRMEDEEKYDIIQEKFSSVSDRNAKARELRNDGYKIETWTDHSTKLPFYGVRGLKVKAQTQAQMEKTVPADVTPVNPAPAVNRAEPLKPGEVPVILEDEEGETVKPKGKTEEESKAEEKVDLSREEKVKKDVETLRDNIINLANSVYSIEMSDNQVTDLMGKVMGFLSESISEVTLGRVQDIVGDLLPRKARLSGRAGQRRDSKFIAEVETNGTEIKAYPVDESQVVSNAGDAVVYKYKGNTYEIITWRANAEEHQEGEKTLNKLGKQERLDTPEINPLEKFGQTKNKIWQVGILDNGKYRQIDIELGPESNKQDAIEELKRRGEKGEILSVVTDREKRLSNRV